MKSTRGLGLTVKCRKRLTTSRSTRMPDCAGPEGTGAGREGWADPKHAEDTGKHGTQPLNSSASFFCRTSLVQPPARGGWPFRHVWGRTRSRHGANALSCWLIGQNPPHCPRPPHLHWDHPRGPPLFHGAPIALPVHPGHLHRRGGCQPPREAQSWRGVWRRGPGCSHELVTGGGAWGGQAVRKDCMRPCPPPAPGQGA